MSAVRLALLGPTLLLAACATSPSASPAGAPPAGVAAAPAGESGGYVVMLGNDTIALERYTRAPGRIEGEIMQRIPTTLVSRYTIALDAAGRPTRMEYATRRPDGSIPPNAARSLTLTFSGDTVLREIQRDTAIRQSFAVRGAYPFVNNSFVMYDLALRALRAAGADTGALALMPIGAQRLALNPWPARLVSPTEARVYYFGDPQRVTLDASGRVISVDATGTTNKVRVTLVPSLDVAGLAAAFAAREQTGGALAQTTRDTVNATLGAASLSIDYGRPVTRGRQIFGPGGVVPPGAVWRTGANQATHFRTDRDLDIGGTTVPAGTYTLWTLPDPSGSWQLIINKQTGQWGTVYDAAQDLARVPLRAESLTEPVERFTIAVEPQGAAGLLTLAWDRTRLSVPVTVK